jgi:hypothetical protein
MMPSPIYFVQECPTCGRRLQIRVEYLGKRVVCQHCQGHLMATDPTNVRRDRPQSSRAILQRADELLESMTPRRPQPR